MLGRECDNTELVPAAGRQYLPKASATLWAPNPNELLIAYW